MKRYALLLLCLPALAGADERILSFHSDLRVFPDGMLEVTETITVRAEGRQIRRGIYRDFPVDYEDRFGNEYRIRFTPLAVQRDGRAEPNHTVRSNRDVRTYFGSNNRFLEHGEHTYVFRYRVNRMLGHFDAHDEIYWNVTGNRWAFPIDKASATVHLEFAAPRDALHGPAEFRRSRARGGAPVALQRADFRVHREQAGDAGTHAQAVRAPEKTGQQRGHHQPDEGLRVGDQRGVDDAFLDRADHITPGYQST